MLHLKFRHLLFGMAASLPLLTFNGAFAQTAEEDAIIAVVEGQNIYQRDFTLAYGSLPPRVRQRGIDELYPHVLELLIQQVLIIKKGRDADLANDPAIQERLRIMEDRLIHDTYLSRQVEERLTEDRLHVEYEKYVASNPPAEEVHARHILVETESEARSVIDLIAQGQEFAELAKRYSKGPSASNGGDLGYFGRGKMVEEFESVAFGLEPNTYSAEPVQTRYGWHVILVEDRRAAGQPSFEQLKPHLAQRVGQSMAFEITRDIVEKSDIQRFDLKGNSIEAPKEPLPDLTGQQ